MSNFEQYTAESLKLNEKHIPANIVGVCEKLQSAGYDGLLVGGCIRDWLMDKTPKDFDVATNATPEQVRRLFKNSRIIGKRFKIVHVHLSYRDYIEVTTYRAPPNSETTMRSPKRKKIGKHAEHVENEKGRLVRDNVYGTLDDDAFRRDFSANALYYDPIKQLVYDYTDGVKAIQQKALVVIGDPSTRFAEDPVRMLRALRFKAKLDFIISGELAELIQQNIHLMQDVSNARLYDETFKLFHHAHGVRSWEILQEYGLINIMFPLTQRSMEHNSSVTPFIEAALRNTDKRVGQNKPVIPAFFFAVILWHALQAKRSSMKSLPKGREGLFKAANAVFSEQYPRIAVPKRVSFIANEIWDMQWALEQRNPRQVARLLGNKRFRASYDFLLLRQTIDEVPVSLTDWWTEIQELDDDALQDAIAQLPNQNSKNKRSKRRRKRNKKPNHKQATNNKPLDAHGDINGNVK